MHTNAYIQAAYKTLKKSDLDIVLENLKKYLNKRGLQKLYPTILRGLLEKIRRSDRRSVSRVVLARESDFKRYQTEIENALKKLGVKKHKTHIDEKIIGGFMVNGNNERMDRTWKSALLHAYQRLTK
jgi:F0F1-type ATP synthase delta subunit